VETGPQIFLSYARQDEEKVKNLYQKLSDEGFKPWMDTKDIIPGENWELAIQKAIRRSDFFFVCLRLAPKSRPKTAKIKVDNHHRF